jgi:hypothetical protein
MTSSKLMLLISKRCITFAIPRFVFAKSLIQ